MGLLKAAGSLEKYGYTFLEKVYFRVGDDYLDNYFYGHVLGLGVNGTLAIVGATYFANVKSPMTAYLFPDSVYGHAAFVKKRSRLEKHGLLYAPRRPKKNDISDGYEPPTMETSPELLEKLALVTFGKKKADPRKMHESVTTLEINLFGKGKPTPVPVTVEGVPKKRGRKRSEDDALDDEEDDDL